MIVYTHTKNKVSTIASAMFYPLVLCIVTWGIAGYFSTLGVDAHHDGILFKPALDVSRGAILFRETFTQYGALTTLLQAWALIVFGRNLLTIQVLTAFFYGLIAALLYIINRRIMPEFLSLITVLLWILMAPYFIAPFLPWASVYALFFQLLGTYCIIRHEERHGAWYLVGAGAATVTVFLTRQPGGVSMLLAVYGYFFCTYITKNLSLRQLLRALYLYTCGVLFTAACFMIWIISQNALRDFWLQSIQNAYNFGALRAEATIRGVFIKLFPTAGSMGFKPIGFLWSLFPIASILTGSASLLALVRKRNVKQIKTVLIIAAVGLSAWNQYYPVNDERHVYWGATQMFGLLTYVLFAVFWYLSSVSGRLRRGLAITLTCIALAYLFAPHVMTRGTMALEKIRAPSVTVSSPAILRGMRMTVSDAQRYMSVAARMEHYFRDNPAGNVVNLTRDALYGALDLRIRNIGPVYINWWELNAIYPDFYARTDAYIRSNKPMVITPPDLPLPDGYCPLVTSPSVNPITLSLPCRYAHP